MAKRVLRYTEEEFITLLENIVKKVKAEKLNESRTVNRNTRVNESPNRTNRRNSLNDRFKKLR